jgi:ubiquinone/menaquinone biosynthesis C-methylase UbiE
MDPIIRHNNETYKNIADIWANSTDKNYDFEFHKKCREIFSSELTGDTILDAGCGLGYDSIEFYKSGLKVFAADIQIKMFINTFKRYSEINFSTMDLCNPAFKSDSFDGIFSSACFLHIPKNHSKKVLTGFFNLLKKNGVLFLLHVHSEKGMDSYIVENVLDNDSKLFCYCHSEKEITNLLIETGFSNIRIVFLQDEKVPKNELRAKYGLRRYYILCKKP